MVTLAVRLKFSTLSEVVSPTMVTVKVWESSPAAKSTVPVTAEKSAATVGLAVALAAVPWLTVQVTVVVEGNSPPSRVMV